MESISDNQTPDFDFRDIHRQCPICFLDACPSRDTCLRYYAGQKAPNDAAAHLCALPQALQGDRCTLYQEKKTVRVAYGFKQSFDVVLKKDAVALRNELLAYFGYNRSYYWHLRGERPLMPEQQVYIENLFRRYGYEDAVRYDRMEDVYVLDAIPY